MVTRYHDYHDGSTILTCGDVDNQGARVVWWWYVGVTCKSAHVPRLG